MRGGSSTPNDHTESGSLTAGGTPDAIIEGIESPYDTGGNRSIVAIHLKDASTFEPFMSTFLNVQQSSDISGSVSVLHGTEFQSSRIGSQVYHVGGLPWWMQLRLWAAEYPWLIAVFVVILAFLFALFARQWSAHESPRPPHRDRELKSAARIENSFTTKVRVFCE